jgi:hypothetical protein
VVFTIRTYFHPITDIAQEPYVPGRLASAIRSWGEDVSRYKGKEMYGDVLLEYLEKKHAEQVEGGLDVDGEEDVARGYPFWSGRISGWRCSAKGVFSIEYVKNYSCSIRNCHRSRYKGRVSLIQYLGDLHAYIVPSQII